jgi:hypothetical protein
VIAARWAVWADDGRGGAIHEVNPTTGDEWTGPDAMRQALFEAADGAEAHAVLIVDADDVAYFVEAGDLKVCPLLVDGRPSVDDAVALDLKYASTGGLEGEWLAEQFNP